MRHLLSIIALALLFVACSSMNKAAVFEFYDSSNKVYALVSAPSQLMREYGLVNKPKMVLIATKSIKSSNLDKQLKSIHSVDAERFGYIVILTNTEKPDTDGYYASTETAKQILSGSEFRITVFDEASKNVASSSTPLSPEELKKHLTRQSN